MEQYARIWSFLCTFKRSLGLRYSTITFSPFWASWLWSTAVTKRDVVNGWIRVCPVLFLHYLRIQSLKNAEQTDLQCSSTDGRTHWNMSGRQGTHDETSLGTLIINTALIVSKISLRQYRRVYLRRFAVWNIPPDVTRNIDVDTLVGFIKYCVLSKVR